MTLAADIRDQHDPELPPASGHLTVRRCRGEAVRDSAFVSPSHRLTVSPPHPSLSPASWDEFIEREAGADPLSKLAQQLGFPESTLRAHVRDGRSPTLNLLLTLCPSWPLALRQRLADMIIRAELARHREGEMDFNRDGVEDLEDAFDAALAACGRSQGALSSLRSLCMGRRECVPLTPHRHSALSQDIDELIGQLRSARDVLELAIAIAQREQLRATNVAGQ